MTLIRRTNGSLFPSIPSIFDDFLTRDFHPRFPSAGFTRPAANVKETDNNYSIEVAVPGMNREDFNIELDNNILVISSEKKDTQETSEGEFTRKEFSYQSFSRAFTLPEKVVNSDKIEAKYADGILYITVPKREEAKTKPARSIKIG